MTKPTKIALIGKMRSGKDAVGQILTEEYGFSRYAFGDEIRSITKELYPQYYEGGRKPRSLLQGFGQDARSYAENVWVDALLRRVDREQPERIVITDLRQPNEYRKMKEQGYVFIRIDADDDVRRQRMEAAGERWDESITHETESYVDGFASDYRIWNNTDGLEELQREVRSIMEVIGYERQTS